MSELIGPIPAAGQGKLAAFLPCSKEIFPVGSMYVKLEDGMQRRPKPVGYICWSAWGQQVQIES